MTKRNVIFSGIQPSGDLHLGNYLGAIRHWVALQQDYDCIYCVVDLHAITVFQDPKKLRNSIRELAAGLIACGVDPKKSILFNQSQNPHHTQLGWIFTCIARMGWLNRMTQFKEKAGKNRENVSTGLFVYPNLMAADILAYHATHVPVGEDQKQHLELTRDIAIKFNNDYAQDDFFPIVEPLIQKTAARIMSLRDGNSKMSKSDPSAQSRITLRDTADEIAQKIRKAKTDSDALPSDEGGLENRPEARNLLDIYAAMQHKNITDIMPEVAGHDFSWLKNQLTDILNTYLVPINQEINRLLDAVDDIDHILDKGAKKAKERSTPIMNKTLEIIGCQ